MNFLAHGCNICSFILFITVCPQSLDPLCNTSIVYRANYTSMIVRSYLWCMCEQGSLKALPNMSVTSCKGIWANSQEREENFIPKTHHCMLKFPIMDTY